MPRIREALPAIEALRALPEEQRPTWEDIAIALSKQGLKTRKGEALTAMRLTSLINAIRSQNAARAKKERSRKRRSDLISSNTQRAQAVGLQSMRFPKALNGAQADAHSIGHGAAGPMRGLARRFGAGQLQDAGDDLQGQGRATGLARLVAQQAVDALSA
jgi:hypothetical protein